MREGDGAAEIRNIYGEIAKSSVYMSRIALFALAADICHRILCAHVVYARIGDKFKAVKLQLCALGRIYFKSDESRAFHAEIQHKAGAVCAFGRCYRERTARDEALRAGIGRANVKRLSRHGGVYFFIGKATACEKRFTDFKYVEMRSFFLHGGSKLCRCLCRYPTHGRCFDCSDYLLRNGDIYRRFVPWIFHCGGGGGKAAPCRVFKIDGAEVKLARCFYEKFRLGRSE